MTYRELDERSNQGAQLFPLAGTENRGSHRYDAGITASSWKSPGPPSARGWYSRLSAPTCRRRAAYILGKLRRQTVYRLPGAGGDRRQTGGGSARADRALLWWAASSPGFESWEEAIDLQPATRIADESNGVPMLYSSGTTGQPLLACSCRPCMPMSTHRTRLRVPWGRFRLQWRPYLSPAPLYHAAPLHYCMMMGSLGGTVVVMEKFDPERALQLIEEHRVTPTASGCPSCSSACSNCPRRCARYDLSSMQFAIHAAAPCPIEVKER